ncbi:hypothetical protein Droror1_Dr00020498 [Drosera rotundifolia]
MEKENQEEIKENQEIPVPSLSIETAQSHDNIPMSLEERFKIIRNIGEECIHDDELMRMMSTAEECIGAHAFVDSVDETCYFSVCRFSELLTGYEIWGRRKP